MEYLLKYLELVLTDQMNEENFERIKRQLTDRVMVVVRNRPE